MIVFVLTPNRTGSSKVAELLHEHFGIFMGEHFKELPDNPKGTYEDVEFGEVHEWLLHNKDTARGERELAKLIMRRQLEHERWGQKAGVLAFLLGFYFDMLDDEPVIIRCRRDFHATCRSWCKVWKCEYTRAVLEVTLREQCMDLHLKDKLVHEIWFDRQWPDDELIKELEGILFQHGYKHESDRVESLVHGGADILKR